MIDWRAEIAQRVRRLHEIAVEWLGEDEARELFVAVTKRGRGKRGSGRNSGRPSKEAERKRRAREPKYEIVGELTEADLCLLDKSFEARLNDADKR